MLSRLGRRYKELGALNRFTFLDLRVAVRISRLVSIVHIHYSIRIGNDAIRFLFHVASKRGLWSRTLPIIESVSIIQRDFATQHIFKLHREYFGGLSHNLGGFLACTLLGLEILLHVQVTVVLDIFINVRAQVCL